MLRCAELVCYAVATHRRHVPVSVLFSPVSNNALTHRCTYAHIHKYIQIIRMCRFSQITESITVQAMRPIVLLRQLQLLLLLLLPRGAAGKCACVETAALSAGLSYSCVTLFPLASMRCATVRHLRAMATMKTAPPNDTSPRVHVWICMSICRVGYFVSISAAGMAFQLLQAAVPRCDVFDIYSIIVSYFLAFPSLPCGRAHTHDSSSRQLRHFSTLEHSYNNAKISSAYCHVKSSFAGSRLSHLET